MDKFIKRMMLIAIAALSCVLGASTVFAEDSSNTTTTSDARINNFDGSFSENVDSVLPPDNTNLFNTTATTEEIDSNMPASVTGEQMQGNGTVIDYTVSGSKAFYTIQDSEQKVFYLIIDMDKTENNVYFLSNISQSELTSNETMPSSSNLVVDPTTESNNNAPITEPQPESSSKFPLFLLVGVGGGVTGYYFLIFKKKKKSNNAKNELSDEDEYEESYEDEELSIYEESDEDEDEYEE